MVFSTALKERERERERGGGGRKEVGKRRRSASSSASSVERDIVVGALKKQNVCISRGPTAPVPGAATILFYHCMQRTRMLLCRPREWLRFFPNVRNKRRRHALQRRVDIFLMLSPISSKKKSSTGQPSTFLTTTQRAVTRAALERLMIREG